MDQRVSPLAFPPPIPPLPELFASAWQDVPLALALRESHRLSALAEILADRPVTERVLDVGVGDGSWWRHLLGAREDVYGIDVNDRELARARRVLPHVAHVDVSSPDIARDLDALGWPTQFGGIIGNCSLEHVPRLDAALANLHRLLAPGGWMVLFVPTPWWAMQGHLQSLLARRAPRLAMMNSGAMNGFFQHWHLLDRPTWTRLLGSHGFEVESVMAMGNARSELLFRLMLPSSFVGFTVKSVVGAYPNPLFPPSLVRKAAGMLGRVLDEASLTTSGAEDNNAYELAIRSTKRA